MSEHGGENQVWRADRTEETPSLTSDSDATPSQTHDKYPMPSQSYNGYRKPKSTLALAVKRRHVTGLLLI
jgi:hypothetical protein